MCQGDPKLGGYVIGWSWKHTLSEEMAQSTVYHHLRKICVYLHYTIMHKVIGVT